MNKSIISQKYGRIAVVCNDTRGGVQPYVALARGLKQAGFDVRAVSPGNLSYMFLTEGIPVTSLSCTSQTEIDAIPSVGEMGTLAAMRYMASELPKQIVNWSQETLAACEGVDVMAGGIGGIVIGKAAADRLGVPFIKTHLQPIGIRTSAFPGMMFPHTPRWLGSWVTHLSHVASDKVAWMPFQRAVSGARTALLGSKSPAKARGPEFALYGFSRHVLDISGATNGTKIATGYWQLSAKQSWSPPTDLTNFLTGSKPIISIGFGSMSSSNPEKVIRLIRSAVNLAGVKAVVLSGWNGIQMQDTDDQLFFAKDLPHDWLFSKVDAIVHHGGAGTTGAALTSGKPTIVVPFTMDQPFWGSRVEALGVGQMPIPRKTLTSENLAEAIRRCILDSAMQKRAEELGQLLQNENGVATAVQCFNP